ncbi:MAG: monovalent cation/H(+) antiporter subunit G [Desulfovibrionales bacterium]
MDTAVVILMILGFIVFTGAVVGILRFPDFYSRLHAAGKMDTLASLLVFSGVALYNLHHFTLTNMLTSLKILFILTFVFLANPTATHAIVDAGFRAGLRPWRKGSQRR